MTDGMQILDRMTKIVDIQRMKYVRHRIVKEVSSGAVYFLLTVKINGKIPGQYQTICLQHNVISPLSPDPESAEDAVLAALSAAILRAHHYAKQGKSVVVIPAEKKYWDLLFRHLRTTELTKPVERSFNPVAYHREYAMA